MALVNEYSFGSYETQNLADTLYKTPSRGTSRRSSRYSSLSPNPTSSLPIPTCGDEYFEGIRDSDVANDEKISILDPRRFTPTLHANLVSEILSLRREIETKDGLLMSLEESLHGINDENAKLNETLLSNSTESKSMKRQMSLLENGTLSALEELARERDITKETLIDTRKRFEESQKKLRNQEQDMDRTQAMWDRDRQNWDKERRHLDLRIHIVEGRLKTVLDEVATAQQHDYHVGADSDIDDNVSNRSASVAGHRRESSSIRMGAESRNGRFSAMSGFMLAGSKVAGMSLAEELELDDGEDDGHMEEQEYDAGSASPDALPEESPIRPRPFSVQSHYQYPKARKILGLATEEHDAITDENPHATNHVSTAWPDDAFTEKDEVHWPYTDTATQSSPPNSPFLQTTRGSQTTAAEGGLQSNDQMGEDHSRKHAFDLLSTEQTANTPITVPMTSRACQTDEQLSDPTILPSASDSVSVAKSPHIEMITIATQTSNDESMQLSSSAASRDDSASMDIPTITIHPPVSRSSSLRTRVVLPPHTKNASSQASFSRPISLRSISVQTEEIRVDQRSVKLPPHLLPSAISSQPPSPSPEAQEKQESFIGNTLTKHSSQPAIRDSPTIQEESEYEEIEPELQEPQQTQKSSFPAPRKAIEKESPVLGSNEHESQYNDSSETLETKDAYPDTNENEPPVKDRQSDIRRPIRSGNSFAGFGGGRGEEADVVAGIEYSDDDLGDAEPIRKTLSKVQNSWKLIPQGQTDSVLDRLGSTQQAPNSPEKENRTQANATKQGANHSKGQPVARLASPNSRDKASKPLNLGKKPDIRRTALISSGAAAHSQRTRSPSAPDISNVASNAPAPPFPVPNRSSSRKIPISASEGGRSPTPMSTSYFGGDRVRPPGRPPPQKPILRKVRSAAAVQKPTNDFREQSQSPPMSPISPSSGAPDSPQLPPLPRNIVTSRYSRPTPQTSHQPKPSSTASQAVTSSTESSIKPSLQTSVEQTSVVDAIAQTMVGEWMWKYVRRRKSFGLPESPQLEFESGRNGGDGASNSGTRHKRWVWLAPYERAIMWSSKQPTSGPALLGKSGRKRE